MREFALGELGWTLDRYLHSTLYEFNLAASGYWRNWERRTAWLAREINTVAIQGNPNIRKDLKPKSPADLFKLSTDRKPRGKKKPSIEKLKETHKKFFEYEPKDTMVKD